MRPFTISLAAAGALAAAWASPAAADILPFTGTVNAIGVVTPDAACAPRGRGNINPATSSGTSNFGAFTYGHTVCTSGPPGGPIDGTFTINFASDGFFGTLSGASARNATVSTFFDFDIDYTILGGTGRFLGATGSFATGPGSGADTTFRPSRIRLNFVDGVIDAPAVPEPTTWGLMIAGFALVGGAMRRRRPMLAAA
jgi:hypothetical protein